MVHHGVQLVAAWCEQKKTLVHHVVFFKFLEYGFFCSTYILNKIFSSHIQKMFFNTFSESFCQDEHFLSASQCSD